MTFSPSLIVDIVLGIICISVIIKYSIEGFFSTILDLARLATSVLLAVMFRGVVAKLFNDLFMTKTIYDWVHGSLMSKIEGFSETVDFVRIYEDAPQFYSKVLALFDLNFDEFSAAISNLNNENVENVAHMIADPLATMLSTLLAVVVIFAISMLVLFFVVKLLNKLTKIKLLNIVNRILGVAFGVLLASVIVWLLSMLLQVLVETIGPMYPEIFDSRLTEESMIINILEEAGLFGVFDGVKSQITQNIK